MNAFGWFTAFGFALSVCLIVGGLGALVWQFPVLLLAVPPLAVLTVVTKRELDA
jgi:hypothetical protein